MRTTWLLASIALLLFTLELPAQTDKNDPSIRLFDEFGKIGSEDLSSRFDNLFVTLNKEPGATGYVYLFCGKTCYTGEIEAHQRGIAVKASMAGFDPRRLIVVGAGYREVFQTELWISTNSSAAPRPRSTISMRSVVFSPRRYSRVEAYDCCGINFWNAWKSIKP